MLRAALALLFGFTVEPAPAPPPAPVLSPAPPATAAALSGHAAPAAAPKVTLSQSVEAALARNPTVAAAQAEVARAEALVRQARSTWLPNITGNAVLTELDGDRKLQDRIIAPATSLNANLLGVLPLVVPQRWVAESHAKDNVETTRQLGEATRRQVAVSAARAYLAIITQHRVIEARQRALVNARAHYDFAHARFAGGVGNRVDEVRAEQELASTEALLENAYGGLERAREALGVLAGAEGPLDVSEEADLANGPALAAALDEVRSKRSDVRAADRRAQAAQRLVDDWKYEWAPGLAATLQPFYQEPPSLTQPHFGWQAQLVLTVPIWDGGLRGGVIAERQALATEAWANLEASARQARSEVRVAFEAAHRAESALESARRAARVATQALELAGLAYRAGATSNIEVIDAERRAQDADTAAAQAEDDLRQARLDVLVASGRFP